MFKRKSKRQQTPPFKTFELNLYQMEKVLIKVILYSFSNICSMYPIDQCSNMYLLHTCLFKHSTINVHQITLFSCLNSVFVETNVP